MPKTDTEALLITMSADLRSLDREMRRAQGVTDKALRQIEKRFDQANANASRAMQNMANEFKTAIAAIGVTAIARDTITLADAWTSTANKLKAAGVEASKVIDTQRDLANLATETRSDYEATVDLYAKLTRASKSIGASQGEVRRVTETVNKALQSAGASASEANSAIVQLGQGLSSGILAGDELKALRENSPVLAQAIADEFGVTIGKLKDLGAEGKLTSERVFKALIAGSAEVDKQFASTSSTVAAAFTNLKTRLTEFVGVADTANGSTASLAETINYVAENIDDFAEAATVAGTVLLTAFGTSVAVRTLTALAAEGVIAAKAMTALNASMAFFGGPIGLGITALAAGVAYLAVTQNSAARSTREFKALTEKNNDVLRDTRAAADLAAYGYDNLTAAQKRNVQEAKKALAVQISLALDRKAEAEKALQAIQRQQDDFERKAIAGGVDPTVARASALSVSASKDREKLIQDLATATEEQIRLQKQLNTIDNAGLAGNFPDAKPVTPTVVDPNALADAEKQAEKEREEIRKRNVDRAKDSAKRAFDDATSIIRYAPDALRPLEEEINRIRELAAQGWFAALGGEEEAAAAYADVLVEMASRTADAKSAIEELRTIENLRADDAVRAEFRIREAARAAREQRDQEMSKVVRVDEVRDDVKEAFRQAVETGNWDQAFRDKLINALDRSLNRMLDQFVDGIFDAMLEAKAGSGKSGSVGGIINGVIKGIGSIFGGPRASGGPVTAGRMYLVGERGPEPFIPGTSGQIVPNNAFGALNRVQVQRIENSPALNVVDNRTINFTGTSGELQQLRQILESDMRGREAQVTAIVRRGMDRRRFA